MLDVTLVLQLLPQSLLSDAPVLLRSGYALSRHSHPRALARLLDLYAEEKNLHRAVRHRAF